MQAYFFMTYIMTTGWAGFPLEILQSSVLILNYTKRMMIDRTKPLLSDVWSLPYYRYVPNVLLFIFLGLTYSIITPLLLPFLLVYFVLGYIVFRNQVPLLVICQISLFPKRIMQARNHKELYHAY